MNRQLGMYYNPFAKLTSQPKIPDGKCGKSLGFQTQTVREITGIVTTPVMHCLMYPGINSGLIVLDDQEGDTAYTNVLNKSDVFGYEGSNDLDATALNYADGSGVVVQTDNYAKWRIVSQGVKLALLNPSEQDDGWYEAIRINWPTSTDDWRLQSRDNIPDVTKQTLTPAGLLANLKNLGSLANEASYSTGTLN